MKHRAKKYVVFNFINMRLEEMLLSYNHGEGEGEDQKIHLIDFDNCAITIKPIVYHSLASSYEKLFSKIMFDLIRGSLPSNAINIVKSVLKSFFTSKTTKAAQQEKLE